MPDWMSEIWSGTSAPIPNIVLMFALLSPTLLVGVVAMSGHAHWPLIRAVLGRHRAVSLVFTSLIAVSVAIGTGLVAQERALRQGTAKAAAPFDMVVAAPGSEVTALLAAVYLQPATMRLVDGAAYDALANHESVRMAAPIAFGDSFEGAPVVGTISELVELVNGGRPEGRMFRRDDEAIAGARVSVEIGDSVSPVHGQGDGSLDGTHRDFAYTVVGKMSETGTPWDYAILVPIESVWSIHGLSNGHGADWSGQLGPPFDPASFPGVPAVLVRSQAPSASVPLRAEFTTDDTMAFFPGAVLARLHSILGDLRRVMSLLAAISQALVTLSVLTGLFILSRLLSRQLALLSALGAPNRFVFGLIWGYAVTLVLIGAVLGLGLGVLAAEAISRIVAARTEIAVSAGLGWPELHLVAGFLSIASVLALLPALWTVRRDVIEGLRA